MKTNRMPYDRVRQNRPPRGLAGLLFLLLAAGSANAQTRPAPPNDAGSVVSAYRAELTRLIQLRSDEAQQLSERVRTLNAHTGDGLVSRYEVDVTEAALADVNHDIASLDQKLRTVDALEARRETAPDAPLPPSGDPELDRLIREAGERHGVDPSLISEVVRQESGFHPRAVSPVGAAGLMQLMPATAARLGVTDRFDPAQNIDGGVRYLRSLLDRFNGNVALALAAYNAGEHRVIQCGWTIPPISETQTYVRTILTRYHRHRPPSERNPTTKQQVQPAGDHQHPQRIDSNAKQNQGRRNRHQQGRRGMNAEPTETDGGGE